MTYHKHIYETAFDSKIRLKPIDSLQRIDDFNQSLEVQKKKTTKFKNLIAWMKFDKTEKNTSNRKNKLKNSLSLNLIKDYTITKNVFSKTNENERQQKSNSLNGSVDSLKSDLSDDDQSSSSEGRQSSISFSSFSSGSNNFLPKNQHFLKNFLNYSKNKVVNMLSPISDKSYQDISLNESNMKPPITQLNEVEDFDNLLVTKSIMKKTKKNLKAQQLYFDIKTNDFDSGISLQSNNSENFLQNSLNDFDDLPFDMPKLNKKLQMFYQQKRNSNLNLNLVNKPQTINTNNNNNNNNNNNHIFNKTENEYNRANLVLIGLSDLSSKISVDYQLPLKYQNWYHGNIIRQDAEDILRKFKEGSFLVRNQACHKSDYILSIKTALGFIHVKIMINTQSEYMLNSMRSFPTVTKLIHFYTINHLPVRGAEHLCLKQPIFVEFL